MLGCDGLRGGRVHHHAHVRSRLNQGRKRTLQIGLSALRPEPGHRLGGRNPARIGEAPPRVGHADQPWTSPRARLGELAKQGAPDLSRAHQGKRDAGLRGRHRVLRGPACTPAENRVALGPRATAGVQHHRSSFGEPRPVGELPQELAP